MIVRRALVVLIVLTTAAGLAVLLWPLLSPGGWTLAKLLMLVCCLGAAPWVGLCVANGLIGFVILVAGGAGSGGKALGRTAGVGEGMGLAQGEGELCPAPPLSTAIAVTVRNEDMAAVLPPLRRLLDELDAAGAGAAFALFVLSDTTEPAAAQAEEHAVEAFRAADPVPARIRYRRRTDNTGFKAGNIMDFLDHHAEGFPLMLVLDADSQMSARAVLRLVHAMQADPSLGIVQHLTVGLPASSAFPRLFQFGMRAGLRTWATAIAWWQGDESCYWGHNAVLRVAAFRAHCRLPLLPGGRHILSHDQVEAAMLCGAGWGIRLLPEEDGSAEANPPALPEFIRRELRWLAGNFEYRHLLGLKGLRPMGRWQLIQAILLFACTPFYVLFLLGAALAAATDRVSPFPAGPALALTLVWAGALYSPKLLGYLELLLSRGKRARYGGAHRLLLGAAAEMAFTLLMDAISALSKTIATVRLACGMRAAWTPQNRTDRGVSWAEAARLLWPHTLLGVVVHAAFASAGMTALLWALPFTGGLLLSVPFCVLTASPRVGTWMQRIGLAAIPEEIAGPDQTW